jgi:membrane protein
MRAAALSFHTLLSLVPVVGLVFWYLRRVGITGHWAEMVRGFVHKNLSVGAGPQALEILDRLTTTASASVAGVVGLTFLAYTAVNLILKFSDSLDQILNTAVEEPRLQIGFLVVFVKRLLILTALPITLMISLVVTNWIRYESVLRSVFQIRWVGATLALPLTWLANIVVVALIYKWVPKRSVKWNQAFKAAAIATPLYELGRLGVGWYNTNMIATQKLYGALAAIPILVLWIQISWMLLLSGALLIKIPAKNHSD